MTDFNISDERRARAREADAKARAMYPTVPPFAPQPGERVGVHRPAFSPDPAGPDEQGTIVARFPADDIDNVEVLLDNGERRGYLDRELHYLGIVVGERVAFTLHGVDHTGRIDHISDGEGGTAGYWALVDDPELRRRRGPVVHIGIPKREVRDCPRCGRKVPATLDPDNGDYTFRCEPCDIHECLDCSAWVSYDDARGGWYHVTPGTPACFLHAAAPFDIEVRIPGTFTVHYSGNEHAGRVTRLVFTPAAGDAGYFGAEAECDDEVLDSVHDAFLVDTGGPFWRAVQDALAEYTFHAVGNDAEDEYLDGPRTAVPIEWVE